MPATTGTFSVDEGGATSRRRRPIISEYYKYTVFVKEGMYSIADATLSAFCIVSPQQTTTNVSGKPVTHQ